MQQGVTTFVEVGPGNVLSGLLKRIDKGVKAFPVNNLKALNELRRRAWLSLCASARWRARRALVTGGSRGIGAAIAEELARAGAAVVFGYRCGKPTRPRSLRAEIGGRAVQADVSDADEAAQLVDEAGDLDILVNNAGLTRDGLLARMSDDDWRDGDRHEPRARSSTPAARSRGR